MMEFFCSLLCAMAKHTSPLLRLTNAVGFTRNVSRSNLIEVLTGARITFRHTLSNLGSQPVAKLNAMLTVVMCIETTDCDLRAEIEKMTSPLEHRTGRTRLISRFVHTNTRTICPSYRLIHHSLLIAGQTLTTSSSSRRKQQSAPVRQADWLSTQV
jgi:hypothetical protein